ncbi:hypothetical protein BKA56DRAFT_610152 [Ilyonectria sp. MPI-CAGE-AT-0026]|nr:hypothetical protein BKA56DRAFT_610152 [Ilyonectria sp. MPI-CAGE-AT-0026]
MTGRCRPGLWRPAQPLQAAKFPHVSPPCDPHALVLACSRRALRLALAELAELAELTELAACLVDPPMTSLTSWQESGAGALRKWCGIPTQGSRGAHGQQSKACCLLDEAMLMQNGCDANTKAKLPMRQARQTASIPVANPVPPTPQDFLPSPCLPNQPPTSRVVARVPTGENPHPIRPPDRRV